MHVHRSLAILALVPALAAMLVVPTAARAQSVPTTTVSGTVYQANGRPASGSLQISWPAFTTAAGQAVAAGRTSAGIGSDGKIAVALAPNIGAMPAGLFYTAVYHLNHGTTSTEYWVVPNTILATIAQVRAAVMPAAQAVQAVNKAYVDQSIAQAVSSQITPTGGTLTGPLYLAGDPTQAAQAANKHYVDSATAQLLPIGGGTLSGPVTAPRIGAVLQADQFPGADFGAQLQACVNTLNPAYGGTCDARNFPGQVTMAGNLTLAVPNVTIYLPCSTIATAASILVPGGTRNVSLHGCASRGTSAASGAQGGTVLLYSGNSALLQVGDSSFLADTKGFRLDNAALNTTGAPAGSAHAISFYRTQEISLASLYLLGNGNQTGLMLDGTGNYSGGTFEDLQFTGFQAAISGIGHTVDNAATTDWLNASTFLRMHIDCPTQGGSPVAGTTGIDLQSGDGNTFTGGDVEGCATALHLGAHAVNNTLVGVRNENSTTQIQADAGSSYNNWMTGGTMYTGKLVDNGTRNSFLDTFHRSFNGVNGDWYGSQQDATVTNHFRLGIGTGSERGLQNRYQTDFGYRWTTGLSDASAGIQYYQVLDELNHVYRLSLGQYNNGQGATNNQTVLNGAGTGAVILNGSNNAGTGGVVFGSGGPSSTTVATVDQAGNANFLGTMLVGGVAQSAGTMTVRNHADAEVDYYLWPGASSSQKGSFTYKDFDGSSQWYMVKDQANNWALNSAPGGLDSFKAYQSTNSGDTYINAAKSTGHIRLNYEAGAGAETDIYSGASSSLAAAFLGPTAIKLPGLAAASGKNCVQIDSAGYLSNTAGGCGLAATVATAGLAFSDGSVQTTSQEGALTGQANDVTARAAAATATNAAATAEGDAQSGISNAAAAQGAANQAETDAQAGITNAAAAQGAANQAETDAQAGITNAAAAQGAANQAETDAQAGITNAAAAQTSATQAEADAQSGITAASAAQSTANAALPANGCATSPGGTLNCTSVAAGAVNPQALGAGYSAQYNTPSYNVASWINVYRNQPAVNANLYTSLDTAHGGSDYAAAINGAVNAQAMDWGSRITAPAACLPIWAPIVVDRPAALEHICVVPQSGGAFGIWGAAPTVLAGVSLTLNTVVSGTPTAGSTTFTVPGGCTALPTLPAGKQPYAIAVGGIGLPPDEYISSCTGSTATLGIPAEYIIHGIGSTGPNQLQYTNTQIGLTTSNTLTPCSACSALTITSLTPSTGTIGLGAAPPTTPVMGDYWVGGTISSTLTVQAVAPAIIISSNTVSLQDYESQKVGRRINDVTIVDPAFTPLTSYAGASVGRSLDGLQGLLIYGQDEFLIDGLTTRGIKGSALILGGPSAGALNQPVRQGTVSHLQVRDSGDAPTGQSSIVVATPQGSAPTSEDRNNTIGFSDTQVYLFHGPSAVDYTSYNTYQQASGLNPDEVTFGGGWNEFQSGGQDTPDDPLTPCSDVIRLEYSGLFIASNTGMNAPDCGGADVAVVHPAQRVILSASRFINYPVSATFTGSVTTGGSTITYVSGGWNQSVDFGSKSNYDGRFVQIYGGGTGCSMTAPFNTYLANSGSQTGRTVLNLASGAMVPANCTGNVTVQIGAGGVFYDLDGGPSNGLQSFPNANGSTFAYSSSPTHINLAAFGHGTIAAVGITGQQITAGTLGYECDDLPTVGTTNALVNNPPMSLHCQNFGAGVLTAAGDITAPVLGFGGATPAASSITGCGTISNVKGAWGGFYFNTTNAGVCTILLTPGKTAANAWYCRVVDITTPADTFAMSTALSATTATLTGTTAASDLMHVECQGN